MRPPTPLASVLLGTALVLTACSSGTEEPAATDDEAATATSAATAESPAATATSAATAESPAAPATDAADGELVVYSGRSQSLVEPVIEDFREETGIDVSVRYGETAELALLLESEGEATDADVFLAQSPGAVAYVDEQGLLASLPEEVRGSVDERFVADDGNWIGITARQRVLVYNQDLVAADELPSSVFDLTDDAWRGRFAVAPTNGSFQDFVSAMRASEGDEATRAWLEGIAANDVMTYSDNSSIVDAVGRGEVEMGLVNHYYNLRFLAENPDLPSRNHHFPDGDIGALLIMSTASVVAGSDAPDEAARFVEFLLSEDAQTYFRDETFEYPLGAGVEAAEELPPLADQELPEVDYSNLGRDLESTLEMIRDAGL